MSLSVECERVRDICALDPSGIAIVPAVDFHKLVARRPDAYPAGIGTARSAAVLLEAWGLSTGLAGVKMTLADAYISQASAPAI